MSARSGAVEVVRYGSALRNFFDGMRFIGTRRFMAAPRSRACAGTWCHGLGELLTGSRGALAKSTALRGRDRAPVLPCAAARSNAIEKLLTASSLHLGSMLVAGFAAHSMNDQNGGGGGCFGLGPNARAVSRCGRLTLDTASCRAYSWLPICLYCRLVSAARNATTSSISPSVSASGCMSLSSQGFVIPSPLL